MWWDDFDQYDGTYVFSDYYNRVPTGTYWHVTEKTLCVYPTDVDETVRCGTGANERNVCG